jgi:hypothetical protein
MSVEKYVEYLAIMIMRVMGKKPSWVMTNRLMMRMKVEGQSTGS